MSKKKTLMERIADMLIEDEAVKVEFGCYSDGSGCWIEVNPVKIPSEKFYSYSVQFNGKGNKFEGVRIFENKAKIEIKTNCINNYK